jgi:hypothetical protein
MLTVVSWKWGRLPTELVGIHRRMIARALPVEHRYVCITDDDQVDAETYPLWPDLSDLPSSHGADKPSCYRRLKIFDPKTTEAMGIRFGSRVLSVDLDVVAIKELDVLAAREGAFVGWRIRSGRHIASINGSIFMFSAGHLPWLWREFDPATSPKQARDRGFFGTDQGWLNLKLQSKPSDWSTLDGILPFTGDVVHRQAPLPSTRLVSFFGLRKPWHAYVLEKHPWIAEHWR